jgi:hypothetical protein
MATASKGLATMPAQVPAQVQVAISPSQVTVNCGMAKGRPDPFSAIGTALVN